MLKLHKPANIMVVGPSGSGKTEFVYKFLKHVNEIMVNPPKKKIFCYEHYQEQMTRLENVVLHKGLPTSDMLKGTERKCLILDDVILDAKNPMLQQIFIAKTHHNNMVTLYLTQNCFAKHQRLLSLNTHIMILFKTLEMQDKSDIWVHKLFQDTRKILFRVI